MRTTAFLCLTALLAAAPTLQADERAPSADQVLSEHHQQIEQQLADIDYKRERVVEANMKLSDSEAGAFWPIYNTYRSESDKLSRESLKILLDYAHAFNQGTVANDDARALITRVESLQRQRLTLRDQYIERVAQEVSPIRAMRFLQIETQLDAMSVLDVGRQVPLAQ
ncbi:MAG: hypothetical protein GAK43_02025 [Stenotrophomonas maltophilia]|nr:MAG: hypothetical protein GAK43_02025 [Stenotrophomonas maltophilia]